METKDKRAMDVIEPRDIVKEINQDVEFDTLISSAGELGRYQILMLFSTLPFHMFSVFVYYSQIFITEVPSHWCWVPELANLTDIQRKSLAIPNVKGSGYSQCYTYNANWTDVLMSGEMPDETWGTVPCQYGWEFNRTEIPYPTISSDLDWVCDKGSYQANAQVIFFSGSFFGGITVGYIADRFGRVPALIVSNLLGCVGGFASTFATNFTQFSICRFIMGMAHDTCMIMPFLIVLEYLAPKYRSVCANAAFAIFYSLFATTIPFIALACGHWKILSLVTSLPLGITILAPIYFPESPRWLLAKGRIDDAIEKVRIIGKSNKKEVPLNLIDQFKETFSKKTLKEVSVFEIFKRPLLRRTVIIVWLVYICCEIVFDGLVRNLQQLDFDFFLSFVASSSTELPSILLCAFTMDIFGRRWMVFLVLMISSLFSVLTVVVINGVTSLVCAVVARFTVNMSYNIMMQWTAELLPTPVRGSGLSLIHIFANLGFIISSYISYLKTYITWLPFVIISVMACVGALLALTLPETAMKDMPHTFDEAEELVKSWKMWEIGYFKRNSKKSKGNVNKGFEM